MDRGTLPRHCASVIPNGPLLALCGFSVDTEPTKHGAPEAKHVGLSENWLTVPAF